MTTEAKKAYNKAYAAANKERRQERDHADRAANPDKYRCKKLRAAYGISLEEFHQRFANQNGACACCGGLEPGGPKGQWNVDHDHLTGEVRGILCINCNLGIGKLGDSIEGLERALAYLKKSI